MPSALVTGASSGIGLELARLLARDGYEIMLAARSADKLNDLAQELGGARTIEVDLSKADGPSVITGHLESVDVLVNNAEESKLVAGRKLPTAAHVAAAGYKAMQHGDVVEVVGAKNRIMAASVRFSPRPVIRRMVHRVQAAKS